MGHPPWGSEHGLYVVDVDAGGALMGREQSNPAGSHEAGGSQLSMGIPWTHRRCRRVPERERQELHGHATRHSMRLPVPLSVYFFVLDAYTKYGL